jgi:hypothetical protein
VENKSRQENTFTIILMEFNYTKITSPYRIHVTVGNDVKTLKTSERESVRGKVTAVGIMESKQRRREECMLIENYLTIFTINLDRDSFGKEK